MAAPVRAPWPPSTDDAAGWSASDHNRGVRRRRRALGGTLIALLVLVMVASGLVVLGSETSSTGLPAFLIGVSLAVLPLPVVLAAFRWVDRFEPEPKALLAFVFCWGATVAALFAGLLNTISAVVVARTTGPTGDVAATAVLVAPWVEEGAKGAAILGVLLFRRKEFDGVVDGIVLAGFVGVGFAFTENVLYFGRAFLAGNEDIGLTGGLFAAGITFVLRGVLAPFAHPLFTSMTGIGLGIAARSTRGPVKVLAPLGGYLLAVLLHATWNFSSLSGLQGFLAGYVVIFVPLFVIAFIVTSWLRRREGATVAAWLPVYVRAGWLADEDVAMLASLPRRKQALAWAERTYGGGSSQALRDFQHSATELAFLRDRAERGHVVGDFAARERELLVEVARTRQAVTSPARM